MKRVTGMRFNQHKLDGWKCSCGEIYYDPEQAHRVLLLNKLANHKFRLKLSQVKSNLILRIPAEVGEALSLSKGDEVSFVLEDGRIVIEP